MGTITITKPETLEIHYEKLGLTGTIEAFLEHMKRSGYDVPTSMNLPQEKIRYYDVTTRNESIGKNARSVVSVGTLKVIGKIDNPHTHKIEPALILFVPRTLDAMACAFKFKPETIEAEKPRTIEKIPKKA